MAKVVMVMRFIGRRRYQTATLESLSRTAGGHEIRIVAIYTPTKLVGGAAVEQMMAHTDLILEKEVLVTGTDARVNQSASVAMQTLVDLAYKGRFDYYAFTEGDVLFNPNWLDKLLSLRSVVAKEIKNAPDFMGPQRVGIGCPIDMSMGWYEPIGHDGWWHKKWMAAQCYVMDAATAKEIDLGDPIYRTMEPQSGWDKEMPSGLSKKGFVHFTPRSESWAQHIGQHGVTSSPAWWFRGQGFLCDPAVYDLYEMAKEVTAEEVTAEYAR